MTFADWFMIAVGFVGACFVARGIVDAIAGWWRGKQHVIQRNMARENARARDRHSAGDRDRRPDRVA